VINLSCGNELNTGNCVCDILAEIARKQRNIPDCQGGCEESVRELNCFATTFNTIPLQLICGDTINTNVPGTCGTVFLARGFRRNPNNNGSLLAASSTWFRVSDVDERRCCAEIELLCTTLEDPAPDNVECLQLVENVLFERTGICVTIDLKCFCGVVCLPAVNAQMSPLP